MDEFYKNLSVLSKLNKEYSQISTNQFDCSIIFCRFIRFQSPLQWVVDSEGLGKHEFWEVNYVLEGESRLWLEDNKKIKIKNDEFHIFPGRRLHALDRETGKFEKLAMGFDFSVSDNQNAAPYRRFAEILEKESKAYVASPELKTLVSLLRKNGEDKRPDYLNTSVSLIKLIIIEMMRIVVGDMPVSDENIFDERIRIAKEYIRQNISSVIKTEDVAGQVYLGSKQLTRIFIDKLGVTPARFIVTERMKLAKELLLTTSMSVADIAEQTGFSCDASFSRAFYKNVFILPNEFRKKYSKFGHSY